MQFWKVGRLLLKVGHDTRKSLAEKNPSNNLRVCARAIRFFTLGSFMKITEVAYIFGLPFPTIITHWKWQKVGWATFWAVLSRSHLVTLVCAKRRSGRHRWRPKSKSEMRRRTEKRRECRSVGRGIIWNTNIKREKKETELRYFVDFHICSRMTYVCSAGRHMADFHITVIF
jgi:hypothetical protein